MVHRMQARRQPAVTSLRAQVGRQVAHAHQAAIGQVATEHRFAVGQQPRAHPAPEAIAAQQRIGLVAQAILGLQADAGRILLEACTRWRSRQSTLS